MEEKKLTDEEIVKALECMANSLSGTSGYTVDIIPYAIDLIHRLQGENKQLKCDSYRMSWKAKFLEAKKEIERLTEELEIAKGTKNRLTISDRITIHDKAVKDTAKEILRTLIEKAYVNECIDLTVAEVKAWFREDYGVEVE